MARFLKFKARSQEKGLGSLICIKADENKLDDLRIVETYLSQKKSIEASDDDFGLTQKGEIQDEAFQILKEKLCNAPVLALPNGPDDFVVYCDATKSIGFGVRGCSDGKIVSVCDKYSEEAWRKIIPPHDLELGAVVFALKSENFLSGTKVLSTLTTRNLQKIVVRFGKKGKLAPTICGTFESFSLERVGPVDYRLKLPQELSCVHDMFHVSNLKKCLAKPDVQVPLDEIKIDENLRFIEEPIEIVERDMKKLKRRRISLVKVRWNSRQGAEYTWGKVKIQFGRYIEFFN
ncbi:putative reverse transcriptase domain-containing protein [Tanacetum coccineum]